MFVKLMRAHALVVPSRTSLCSADAGDGGDGGDGGGAGDGVKKQLSQDEVNRIAAKQKKEGERAGREAAEAEWKEKYAELEAKLEEQRKAAMTADERAAEERKQRDEAEKRTRDEREAKLKKERDEAKAGHAAAVERWKNDRRDRELQTALIAAKVYVPASEDAAASMLRNAKIELDDDGSIKSIVYAGKAYDTLEEAAKRFIEDKPHFAQASGVGGAGTRAGNSGGAGANSNTKLHELSREDLTQRILEEDKASGRASRM